MLDGAPPDAPWTGTVRREATDLARRLGKDLAALGLDGPAGGAAGGAAGAIAALPPDQQQAAIRSMVAGLAARLEANPANPDGWARLARSYQVLGEGERALAAFGRAADAAPDRIDLLLAHAHALHPPGSEGEPPEAFYRRMAQVLALRPDHPEALWFMGQQARAGGDAARAIALWTKLLDLLPPSPDSADADPRRVIERAIADAKAALPPQ